MCNHVCNHFFWVKTLLWPKENVYSLIRFYDFQVCMLVCGSDRVCAISVFETVTATGAAGTDWLHNLVCSLCLAPWMADSRLQTHTHACLHVLASAAADATGVNAQPVVDGDTYASLLMNERAFNSSMSVWSKNRSFSSLCCNNAL